MLGLVKARPWFRLSCGSHQLPVFLKYSVPLKLRENFCLSCETDTAAISFWWGVIDIWWQIASGLDQWEFPVAGRTGNFWTNLIYAWRTVVFFSVSHHSPSPFLHSLQTFRSNMDAPSLTVARVSKKYDCFAVYPSNRAWCFDNKTRSLVLEFNWCLGTF